MRNFVLPLALIAGVATAAGAQTTMAPTTPPAATATPAAPAKHGHHGSPLMAADTNHDGTVTKEEMLAAADARAAKMAAKGSADATSGKKPQTPEAMHARASAMFDRMDTNHDGKLDSTEIAAREGMMPKGKKMGMARNGGGDTGADAGGE